MGWTFLGGTALFVADSPTMKGLLLLLGLAQAAAILAIKTTPGKPQPGADSSRQVDPKITEDHGNETRA
jgi:hypothetical protein